MLGNLSDIFILVVVALLLMGGQKDISGTVRNIGKTLNEFKRRQAEFRNELERELSPVDEMAKDMRKDIYSISSETKRDLSDTPSYPSYPRLVRPASSINNEARIKELERQISDLQKELERLKNDGKN
ncbi:MULTISPECIES: twin-arginine translocase TatA/TatE family subunit [Acidianus]|uniref:Translocase n=1 Tax=Candidatus Acidianus copahuensis TaxID=1160895 RepID=A0A031LMD3_9CREN|nr:MULTISPECIES: twin-arginine translocase TatA/TatE family subunit [Acidianus]EZQ02063.1 hypothetical protein CM19_11380 [Candidatus Acidianus copahuensis]NON62099.1 twin-arginine translocase TatA/TatE family subunit [Acidianus sp. RZ1]